MKPKDERRQVPPDQVSNWLKGTAMLRAYMAQRDHFLELHDRAGYAAGRGQRPGPAQSVEEKVE
jgi:hypothetical protein